MARSHSASGANHSLQIRLLISCLWILAVSHLTRGAQYGTESNKDVEHKGEWAIKLIPNAAQTFDSQAKRLADDLGLVSVGQVCSWHTSNSKPLSIA